MPAIKTRTCEARNFLDQTPCKGRYWGTVKQGNPPLKARLCWLHARAVMDGQATLAQALRGERRSV